LSKLAAEDIDHLLAEADAGHSAPTPASPPGPRAESVPSKSADDAAMPAEESLPSTLSNEIDELLAEADGKGATPAGPTPQAAWKDAAGDTQPAAVSAAETDEIISKQAEKEVDRLVAEADGAAPAAGSTPAQTPGNAAIPAAPSPGADDSGKLQAPPEPKSESSPASAQAPASSSPTPATASPPNPSAPPAAFKASELEKDIFAEEQKNPPLLIRLLERINSPMESLDESIINAIGYGALLTIFNALLVLAYVKFVRKH